MLITAALAGLLILLVGPAVLRHTRTWREATRALARDPSRVGDAAEFCQLYRRQVAADADAPPVLLADAVLGQPAGARFPSSHLASLGMYELADNRPPPQIGGSIRDFISAVDRYGDDPSPTNANTLRARARVLQRDIETTCRAVR